MSRLQLDLELKHQFLPLNYKKGISSIIREITDSRLVNFDEYCYSVKLPSPQFTPKCVNLKDKKLSVIFSTSNTTLLLSFNNFFQTNKDAIEIYKNELYPKDIKLIPSCNDFTRGINIKFISPLVVRVHCEGNNKSRYIVYSDVVFKQQILFQLLRRFPQCDFTGFDIIPINPKTVITNLGPVKIPATIGEFYITGNPELLKLIYYNGLGSYRNAGFGLFITRNKDDEL